MPAWKLGLNAKLYRAAALFTDDEAVDVTGASLTEIDVCRDVTVGLTRGEADVTTRANNGWMATAPTLLEATVDFDLVTIPSNANYLALLAAFMAGTEIGIVALSGDKTAAYEDGPAGNWIVSKFERAEPLTDAIKVSVTLKPSSQMQWYAVSS